MTAYPPFPVTYTPQPTRCTGSKVGTETLQDWICDQSPWRSDFTNLGTYNCRNIAGTNTLSAHATGRSGDSGVRVLSSGHPAGHALSKWLVANHAVLGIQEVIWNRQRWDNRHKTWQRYRGVSPHLDHVHWTLNADGAAKLTLDRIRSVAPGASPSPPPQEDDFLAALTALEQKELLSNSRQAETSLATIGGIVKDHSRQFDEIDAVLKLAARIAVIRKSGTAGMTSVSLACGNTRMPLKTQAAADQFKYVLGQPSAYEWPAAMFDALHVLS